LKFLVVNGFTIDDIRCQDNEGIFFAFLYEHIEIIQYLMKMGLTVDDLKCQNNLIMTSVCSKGNLEYVKFLFSFGFTINDVHRFYYFAFMLQWIYGYS